MRIEALWIEGFRSIQSLRLEGLRSFNVFYGPNGSGKSNVLEALALLGRALRVVAVHGSLAELSWSEAKHRLMVAPQDFCLYSATRTMRIGVRVKSERGPVLTFKHGGIVLRIPEVALEVKLDRRVEAQSGEEVVNASLTGLKAVWGGDEAFAVDLLMLFDPMLQWDPPPEARHAVDAAKDGLATRVGSAASLSENTLARLEAALNDWLTRELPSALFRVVPATRSLAEEEVKEQDLFRKTPSELLDAGRFKEALFSALVSPDPTIRRGLLRLRTLLSGPPLHRPHFDPVFDPKTGRYDLQEQVTLADAEERSPAAMSLDHAGLGVLQVYYVLAEILLGHGHVVAVEEPEAHLHAPTTGRALRQLLRRVVDEGYIQQLFVATHSNLFDLDPEGYFDVRLDPERGTIVEWCPDLSRIDRDHLWEPGPAKHALQDMLGYLPPETVVFRRADGSPIDAREMLSLLQEDHDDALSFLKDVHGAALRVVGVRARRDPVKAAG